MTRFNGTSCKDEPNRGGRIEIEPRGGGEATTKHLVWTYAVPNQSGAVLLDPKVAIEAGKKLIELGEAGLALIPEPKYKIVSQNHGGAWHFIVPFTYNGGIYGPTFNDAVIAGYSPDKRSEAEAHLASLNEG